MELWIPLTLAAAFLQNIRSALQKVLKDPLSDAGATFVRFGFGFPLALIYLFGLQQWMGVALPTPNLHFVGYLVLGGSSQIVATFLLVRLFSLRNFAVGTAYSKTDPILAALFGLVLLGESVALEAGLGILISTLGVGAVTLARSERSSSGLWHSLTGRTARIGLASGALFGIAGVAYRGASLALDGPGFLLPAAVTLASVTVYQSAVMGLYLYWREPGQLSAVIRNWRLSAWVGGVGVVGSAGWFTAMTLQNVAYVKALGQIELLFTFAVSTLYFREHVNRLEFWGIASIVFGIVLLLLAS